MASQTKRDSEQASEAIHVKINSSLPVLRCETGLSLGTASRGVLVTLDHRTTERSRSGTSPYAVLVV